MCICKSTLSQIRVDKSLRLGVCVVEHATKTGAETEDYAGDWDQKA